MADTAYMQYEHESGTVARWHGGEYIELGYFRTSSGDSELGEFSAQDVINVWDHAKGEPRIPRTLVAFQARVDKRLAELVESE